MHLTRAETSRRIPISRKGTKYIARPLGYVSSSIPVIVAVRDMLKVAKTLKEVQYMIKQKAIKINGRFVKDYREPIKLFNLFETDKKYRLIVLPTGRFSLEESKGATRLVKVIGKKILRGKKTQFNFHDGTNIVTDKKLNIHDTVELDSDNKVKDVIPMDKSKKITVISGRSIGHHGKVENVDENKAKVKLDNGKEVELDKSHIMTI